MDNKKGMGSFQKLDNRIRVMLQNGIQENYRSIFVMVGDKGKDQVPIMHNILSKSTLKSRPNVLWCYKKELGFSTHRKKVMKALHKKRKSGKFDGSDGTLFEQFICGTDIRWCYYTETYKILGQTFGMLVLQDFETLTPNILARTIETVSGGGLVVFLLHTMSSLKQLYNLAMDVHSRYRTEAHQDVVCRFNERFLLSLASNSRCLLMDDHWQLLPISRKTLDSLEPLPRKSIAESLTKEQKELKELKTSLESDSSPFAPLVRTCVTLDQARALVQFLRALVSCTRAGYSAMPAQPGSASKSGPLSKSSTVVMTASRGRGKSAALGLGITAAIEAGLPSIAVTAPSPENLSTVMQFVLKGLQAMSYEDHIDFEATRSTDPDHNKAIIRVDVFRKTHRQSVFYLRPWESYKLGQVDLICIDEAAAIPLPLVRPLLKPQLVFLSSTVNGYEGTGRSLSLKLISQLRKEASNVLDSKSLQSLDLPSTENNNSVGNHQLSGEGRQLYEIELKEAIRYGNGDPVERWLYDLLCLDCSNVVAELHKSTYQTYPSPDKCELYYVNRDTLFSYHKFSELFLQRLMALYVASHYKNTPNDLQLLSDAPAHHIFCLLAPYNPTSRQVPEIICVLQVCLEGDINRESVMRSLSKGVRPSGDMIPWTVTQQYCDPKFGELSGCRVVRIATDPDYQGMGYGSEALKQLQAYYEGHYRSLDADDESVEPRVKVENQTTNTSGSNLHTEEIASRSSNSLPPLLSRLSERTPESLHYLGVSFGMTHPLLKFWNKAGFVPLYIRQNANDLTGEFSCIMLKQLSQKSHDLSKTWLIDYFQDFSIRFCKLLGGPFRCLESPYALEVLTNKINRTDQGKELSPAELSYRFSSYDLQRLDNYRKSLVDYHIIFDQLEELAMLYFSKNVPLNEIKLSKHQQVILLGVGLQHKTVNQVALEIDRIVSTSSSFKSCDEDNRISDNIGAALMSAAEQPQTELPRAQQPSSGRVMGLLHGVMKEMSKYLNNLVVSQAEERIQDEKSMPDDFEMQNDIAIKRIAEQSDDDEEEEDEEEDETKQLKEEKKKKMQEKVQKLLLEDENPERYAIHGSHEDWRHALSATGSNLDSIKLSIKSTLHQKRKGREFNDQFKSQKKRKLHRKVRQN